VQGGKHELVTRATTTPDSALLFRKDLVHEGRMVLGGGTKEILSLNLWATRRDSQELLRVTFPSEDRRRAEASEARAKAAAAEEEGSDAETTAEPERDLQSRASAAVSGPAKRKKQRKAAKIAAAASTKGARAPPMTAAALREMADERSYVLGSTTLRALPSCILNNKLHFEDERATLSASGATKRTAVREEAAPAAVKMVMRDSSSSSSEMHGGGLDTEPSGGAHATAVSGPSRARPRVVTFECELFSYEEFSSVFRVLLGLYIRPVDLVQHRKALDYFGIPLSAVLVSIVAAGNAGLAQEEDRCVIF
jgi:hypothetical protein